MKRTALLAAVGTGFVASVALGIACTTTADPRAGTKKDGASSSSSSNGGSSSGGIDATPPDGPISCGDAPNTSGAFSKAALLGAVSDCAAWHSCNFLNAATALQKSVRDGDAASTRTAWKTAMNEWSKMELFQFGPLGSKVSDPYHGRGLRTFVHPWPQTSRCEVEKQIAVKEWQSGGIGAVLPSGRGLFALEYVFFYAGTDTACLPDSPTGQAWSKLVPADLEKAKSEYAVAVADNIVALALEIQKVWASDGESFKTKLTSFDGYASDQEALNVVGWALFYAEKELKDFKLAPVAGVSPAAPNPETPFALVEIENIRTNLRAFESLYAGCADGNGLGFDDWLTSAGQGGLANEITTALANATSAADAFPSFGQANQEQLKSLYDTIKVLSDLLKSRMFGSASPLNLKLPAGVASDTD